MDIDFYKFFAFSSSSSQLVASERSRGLPFHSFTPSVQATPRDTVRSERFGKSACALLLAEGQAPQKAQYFGLRWSLAKKNRAFSAIFGNVANQPEIS